MPDLHEPVRIKTQRVDVIDLWVYSLLRSKLVASDLVGQRFERIMYVSNSD